MKSKPLVKDCIEQHFARLLLTLKSLVEVCCTSQDREQQESRKQQDCGWNHGDLPRVCNGRGIEDAEERTCGYARPKFRNKD
jgi:hypothetical protein